MAMTFRNVLNRVLGTVSEDKVDVIATELTSDYHKLVATFVNQIKEEIEAATFWSALWVPYDVAITGGVNNATIVGSNERSRLVRVQDARLGMYLPLVFDITNPTQVFRLQEMDAPMLYMQALIDQTQSNQQPAYFNIAMQSDGTQKVTVYPTPSINRTLRVVLVTPQAELADTDLDVVIKIPSRPLILGSIYYALAERGEELGVNNIYTEERYEQALNDTVAGDIEAQGGIDLVAT